MFTRSTYSKFSKSVRHSNFLSSQARASGLSIVSILSSLRSFCFDQIFYFSSINLGNSSRILSKEKQTRRFYFGFSFSAPPTAFSFSFFAPRSSS